MYAAASMVVPGLRYASLLYRAFHPPSWAGAYISYSWGALKVAQLGFAVPLFIVLVQVSD
jgi:hypothetical protein